MKTKIIPFDLETAKKIQAGEIEGKIKQLHGEEVQILCWDLENVAGNNLAVKHKYFDECCDDCGIHVDEYNAKGEYWDRSDSMAHNDLVLEVPDNEPQFKPFDKVLARENDASLWKAGIYSHELEGKHCVCGNYYSQCITYEGHENLVGGISKPK